MHLFSQNPALNALLFLYRHILKTNYHLKDSRAELLPQIW